MANFFKVNFAFQLGTFTISPPSQYAARAKCAANTHTTTGFSLFVLLLVFVDKSLSSQLAETLAEAY